MISGLMNQVPYLGRWEVTPYTTYVYICIIYTPNLGLTIADVGQEREQSRFRGSMEGAKRSTGGARESIEGAQRSSEGARGRSEGASSKHGGAEGVL